MRRSNHQCLPLRHLSLYLLWYVLLLVALPGCSSNDWYIELRVSGLTEDIVRLSVNIKLNGESAISEVTRSLDHFAIRLVSGALAPGSATVEISALGMDGCQRAAASVSVAVPAAAPTFATLTANRGCRVVISRSESGTGQVRVGSDALCQLDGAAKSPVDPTCQADPSDGPDACAFCLPIDTSVQLVQQADPGFYFSGWAGTCQGRDCAFPIASGVVRVQAAFVPKLVCSVDHICWENPLPAKISNAKVFARTTDDGWLVGDGGLILHWNGVIWLPQASGMNTDLNAAWGSASDDLWVVGEFGTSLHWDGRSFTPFPVDTELPLVGVAGGPSGVWAIGEVGDIFRWNGTDWQRAGVVNGTLAGISQSADGEIWIAGTNAAGQGIVIHWDPQTLGDLSRLTSFPVQELTGVWAAGRGEAFAVGEDSVLHFRNGSLVMDAGTEMSRAGSLTSVWGSSPNDVWAAGYSGSAVHFDGAQWTTSYVSQYLLSLSGSRPDDIWITDEDGNLLRWNGAYWLPQLASITDVALHGISGAGSDFYVAGGSLASTRDGIVLHGYEDAWQIPASLNFPTDHWSCNAVWAIDSDRIFFAGNGGQISSYRKGVGITGNFNPTTQDLFAIWGTSASEIYTAGAAATLYKYNGASWSRVMNPAFDPMTTFTGLGGGKVGGTSEVWIVGTAGEIWRGNGTSFTLMPLPPELFTVPDFHAVFWNASNDVWIAGDEATLLHWDGTRFTLIELDDAAALENLFGVWSSGPGDAWVVGDHGGIWHYSGTVPAAHLESGSRVPLNAVYGNRQNGKSNVVFVGQQGSILRYRP